MASTVIKETDKGGTVIILSKNYYRAMIYEPLTNKTHTKNQTIMWTHYDEKMKTIKQIQNCFHIQGI